jgi:hypothetical protein
MLEVALVSGAGVALEMAAAAAAVVVVVVVGDRCAVVWFSLSARAIEGVQQNGLRE